MHCDSVCLAFLGVVMRAFGVCVRYERYEKVHNRGVGRRALVIRCGGFACTAFGGQCF